MEIAIQLTDRPIPDKISPPAAGLAGAWVEFRGTVRGEENGERISALQYEAYPQMAESEIRRLLSEIDARHACIAATVIHRVGLIPVGEAAIYVGIAARHRGSTFAVLTEFMDRLKQDVPIWKRGSIKSIPPRAAATAIPSNRKFQLRSLDEGLGDIESHCEALPAVRVSLSELAGRVLRETVRAKEDSPASDRSTRDGYAVLLDDNSESFSVVDTLHAADWKPRRLSSGEAVRVATGAALPGENLRVIMQEQVERIGDRIRIVERNGSRNVRLRGEEMRGGDVVLSAGSRLDAGALALLASVGCAYPLVSPRLRVLHFTTGDEIISPSQTPKPGEVRDSNSIFVRSLLEELSCEVTHRHLPEDFARARAEIERQMSETDLADVILVSGGASVGEKDFTRPLLEWLGFEILFSQVNLRPGRPLIFGAHGRRIAFGLPGNPLSHLVCFHVFVAAALAKLSGARSEGFKRAILSAKLEDAPNPRETLWPSRMELRDGRCLLAPLNWSSSGDVSAMAHAHALIRVPANAGNLAAGAVVDFMPLHFGTTKAAE